MGLLHPSDTPLACKYMMWPQMIWNPKKKVFYSTKPVSMVKTLRDEICPCFRERERNPIWKWNFFCDHLWWWLAHQTNPTFSQRDPDLLRNRKKNLTQKSLLLNSITGDHSTTKMHFFSHTPLFVRTLLYDQLRARKIPVFFAISLLLIGA